MNAKCTCNNQYFIPACERTDIQNESVTPHLDLSRQSIIQDVTEDPLNISAYIINVLNNNATYWDNKRGFPAIS